MTTSPDTFKGTPTADGARTGMQIVASQTGEFLSAIPVSR